MKPRLGWTRDPALHLIVLAAGILVTALAVGPQPGLGQHSGRAEHPRGCHACSACPADAAAVRDAYLIRTGSIEPVADGE